MEYALQILVLVLIYAILALSLDLVVGHTGILTVCHAAFFGIGAYCEALMTLHLSTPFILNIGLAMTAAGVVACAVAVPSFRLRGESFIIATFAFQIVFVAVLNNWPSLTGGPAGLSSIPSPTLFGYHISSQAGLTVLAFLGLSGAIWVYLRIARSPFGRVLRCLREDETLAHSMGKSVMRTKVTIFAVSGAVAGAGGALFSHYLTFIDPNSFSLMESVFLLSIVIIGGAGTLRGPVIGTVTLIIVPELLRFIGLPSSLAANIRQIIYGGLLVAFMMWRPRGLLGKYAFHSGEVRK